VLLIGTLLFVSLRPLFTLSTTVTLVPVTKQISTTKRLILTTGQAIETQLQGRALPAVTMSQEQDIPTTGKAHQDARTAHGYITFYNAATYPQTVTAGTLLTGNGTVQVVTDQDAILPAASYPTFGQATVSAHVTITGPAGNIQAGTIYGPCCRMNVSAVNSAFSGGAQARDYQTVSPQDITSVVANLKASLLQSEQAALETQVHPDETLLTPLPCQQTVTPDHQPGAEATQVQVMVSELCKGMVYHTQAYQSLMAQIANQEATQQLGNGYTLTGAVQSTITQATPQKQNTMILQVNIAGTYAYQLSQEQLQQLPTALAGKSKAKAIAFLLHTPGIQSVSVSSATLPTDTEHIHVMVVYAG
jgi:hypothetical protein